MYIYRDGLKCLASRGRVIAYQLTVPFLSALAAVVGFIFIVKSCVEAYHTGFSLLVGLVLAALWLFLCVSVVRFLFVAWCKPVFVEE